MAKDFQEYIAVGRLGDLPEMRYTPSGTEIASVSIAVGDDYYDKNSNEWVERTLWVRPTAFGPLAERLATKFEKGDKVLFKCTLQNNSYEKDGVTVHTYNFRLEYIAMMEKARGNDSSIDGGTESAAPSTVREEIDDDAVPW